MRIQHARSSADHGWRARRRHTEELFRKAGESSAAVQDAGAAGAALLKGAHKRAVVQHEEALKRHVFAQMLQHGAPPRAA